jgi:phosphoglycerate dehydrogenase-like enzyme
MIRILYTGSKTDPEILGDFAKNPAIDFQRIYNPTKSELSTMLDNADIYVKGDAHRIDTNILSEKTHPRLIIFAGTDHSKYIDENDVQKFGIEVKNAAGANSESVAEHAVSLLLSATKGIPELDRNIRNGLWLKKTTFNLRDKMIGVLGMGRIGTRVAEILDRGFGSKILYFDLVNKDIDFAKFSELGAIFKSCNAIIVSLASSPKTANIINFDLLTSLKQNSILINVARAEIFDKDSLYDFLKKRDDIFYATDVFYHEPIFGSDEEFLLSRPNTILTSHNAFNSTESLLTMEQMISDLIQKHIVEL